MPLRRITLGLLVLYTLLTVSSIFSFFALLIAPLAGMAFALLHAGQRERWRGALTLLVLVIGVSLLFESVGVATGWVYGPYHYTTKLGPKFLGLVPYLIPLTWFMMSYPSFVIADRLVAPAGRGRRGWRLLAVAAVGGLVMTAWDLIMDPIMVAGGHWVWDTDGAYFGIPLQNFWGWWLTVFTTFALYLLIRGERGTSPDPGFDRQAVVAYAVTGLGMIASSLQRGADDLALIGLFAMLPWVLAAWSKPCAPEAAAG